MRVAFENGTVHECTGVALVCITYNVFLACGLVGGELPLSSRREACAATTAETGREDCIYNLLRLHLRKNLAERLIAVRADIFVNAFGVDYAAVAESNAVLLFIELRIGEGVNRFGYAFVRFLVKKSFNKSSLEEMLLNDFFDIVNLDVRIECAFGIDNHDRTVCAKSETTRLNYLDLIRKTCELKLFCHRLAYRDAAGRCTARTAADKYV